MSGEIYDKIGLLRLGGLPWLHERLFPQLFRGTISTFQQAFNKDDREKCAIRINCISIHIFVGFSVVSYDHDPFIKHEDNRRN